MKVYQIISMLKNKEQKISIRKQNRYYCITRANSALIEDLKDREIIDIIPQAFYGDDERGCFVINIK